MSMSVDNRTGQKAIKLPEKRFFVRNSLITDLTEKNDHIKTVYHLFITIFVGLFINTVVYDFLKHGEIQLGMKLIRSGFQNFHMSLFSWLLYFAATCTIYPWFILWAKQRRKNYVQTDRANVLDYVWLGLLVCFYFLSFEMVPTLATKFQLGPVSTACIVLEQIRLIMKVHAFVRHNVPKVLKYKPKSEEILELPSFGKYLFFLFAPTLIYRDEYPRSTERRWSFIFWRALEIVGTIFYICFIINRFLIPAIEEIGTRPYSAKEIIISIFESAFSGILILLAGFYVVLHSAQNLFAELMYFGDRMFYEDWWTCTSYAVFYRKWNVVVYDWLYTYIYKDMIEIITPNNKLWAKLTVFTISAVVHEWVLINMFGFFLPLLFVFYFIGTVLNLAPALKNAALNILFLYSLGFGMGTLVFLYGLEYMIRINTPLENPTVKDFFVSRFLTCDCIKL